MKILLAEDDINLGKLLSMLLKKQNITVNWVQDGEAAYDAVYADGYDVLVLFITVIFVLCEDDVIDCLL